MLCDSRNIDGSLCPKSRDCAAPAPIPRSEETGEIDDLMDEIAGMYEREVDYELKTLSAQIEPILIVALGILVLILALGVFLPVWALSQAAMKK